MALRSVTRLRERATCRLGWLLWRCRPLPKPVLVIPVLYALATGGTAGTAASPGIVEDIGLVVTAVVAAGLLLVRDRSVRLASGSARILLVDRPDATVLRRP
jgi:hypothetical protein